MDSYTVFDVETANRFRESICSIGYVRVENGEIIDSREILINPEMDFDVFNIRVHGITPQRVMLEKTFPEVWKEIQPYFSNTILVAHNARSMDLCALTRMLNRYNIKIPNNKYVCTLELARKMYSVEEVGAYKLNILCQKFNIPLEHHHNALDDAMACYNLLQHFLSINKSIVPAEYVPNLCKDNKNDYIVHKTNFFSEKTTAMQELYSIVLEVMKDNIVTEAEAQQLLEWMNSHSDLEGFYPYDKIFNLISNILSDGVISEDEEKELKDLLDAFINPKTTKAYVNVNEKIVCLSGEFNYGPKNKVEEYFISKGAKISNSITKKVDILVLGEYGNTSWKYGNYGTKYEKAKRLNENGSQILIYKENDIIGLLNEKINIEESLNKICEKIENENGLYPNKIIVNKSTSKKGDNYGNVVSMIIQIIEAGYPSIESNSVSSSVLRIPIENVLDVNISNKHIFDYLIKQGYDKMANVIVNQGKSNEYISSRFVFPELNEKYFEFVEKAISYAIKIYSSSNSFGCCSRFKECSQKKECIHPNKLYATACAYKKQLDKGNIFYA